QRSGYRCRSPRVRSSGTRATAARERPTVSRYAARSASVSPLHLCSRVCRCQSSRPSSISRSGATCGRSRRVASGAVHVMPDSVPTPPDTRPGRGRRRRGSIGAVPPWAGTPSDRIGAMDPLVVLLIVLAVVVVLAGGAALVVPRLRRRERPAPRPREPVEEAAPGAVSAPQRPERPAPTAGRLVRLRGRLARSQNVLGRGLLTLLSRDHLDEQVWEEVEEVLISADVGVEATTELVERLRERTRVLGTRTAADVRALLAEELR